MKRILSISFMSLWMVWAYAITPSWIRHVPSADNDTYRFVVESAVAASEEAALNKAMGLVLQHAIMPLGLPFNSTQVEDAIKNGRIESMVTEFKIPINKVCTYRMKNKGGGLRVYVLCQVAVAGNIQVRFTEFKHCGSAGDDDEVSVSMRPDEWGLYETDRYFSVFQESELTKGQSEIELKKQLTDWATEELVNNTNLKDSFLIDAIQTKSYFDKNSKTVFGVAYVEREQIIKHYSASVERDLEAAYNTLKNIQSYLDEQNIVQAKALIKIVRERLDNKVEPKLNFLRTYSVSRATERNLQDCNDLRSQLKEKAVMAAGDDSKARENKIQEYIRDGMMALKKENKLGDALRYLFGAQVLLADLPNKNTFTAEVLGPDGKQQVNAGIWLPQQIKNILEGVKITFDGFLPGSDTEAKLSFHYNDKAVTNLNYTYNDNTGWNEDNMPVKDGWTVVTLPANNKPQTLHVKLEYRYADEAAFDADLQLKMMKYGNTFNYDNYAKHIVPVVNRPVAELDSNKPLRAEAVAPAASTDMTQNIVAKKIKQARHIVSSEDSVEYQHIIDKVCNAVTSKDYQSVYTCFTNDGYDQFEKLVKYGKARIICHTGCRYVRLGDYVMCRSIPMAFTFSKGKQTFENVVFTFDENKKIDGIQFALEERSARNIMADTRYNETSQLTLINFMENYKTAFALKRLDYIESIFADDAVIITGRVLQRAEKTDNNQIMLNNIVYKRQSKKEYLERLATSFSSKEWINIKFGNTEFEKSAQGEQYGIRLLQDYSSSNYGDRGYLFLLIDVDNQDAPLIRVRTWQPETAGSHPFSLADYDELTQPKY